MVKLIRSGLRKDRAILLIFLLIIILSTLLMHTGLMASDYKKLYEQQVGETGVTDYIVYTFGSGSKAEEWFGRADHVQSFQRSDVVFLRSLEISSDKFAKDKTVTNWMFEKSDERNGYDELRFVERDDSVGGRKIYLNLYTAYSSGLCTGDRITADMGFGKYEFTVMLVIRLLLKTVFVKREKEFGIKKAVGFTSTQLRYQLSLSLLPTTLIASAAGAVMGYFGINPLFALVLGGYGIKNSDLMIKAPLIILPIAAVTILVFLFSFIMSGRMKKLSAYKLIQE